MQGDLERWIVVAILNDPNTSDANRPPDKGFYLTKLARLTLAIARLELTTEPEQRILCHAS